jgi:phosphate transport system protein
MNLTESLHKAYKFFPKKEAIVCGRERWTYQEFYDRVNALSLPHMASLVIGMIRDSLKAYENEDLSLVAHHSARDDAVDALRHTIFRDGITYMMEDPRTITKCTNYLMVARYLERCGDHACKIAEKVTYMVTGDQIEIR